MRSRRRTEQPGRDLLTGSDKANEWDAESNQPVRRRRRRTRDEERFGRGFISKEQGKEEGR